MRLHGFFRSSAAWRVRIALGLKGMTYEQVSHHLRRGEHLSPEYLAINPQGLLPAFELDDGQVLTQSLAICEYLDEIAPEPPLLPRHPLRRADARSLAEIIACDVHPVQNLKILTRLRRLGADEEAIQGWARETIEEGLGAFEARVAKTSGRYCVGDMPTLADICLIPQLGNARRFGAPVVWPRILAIESACLEVPAFALAAPDRQPDAE